MCEREHCGPDNWGWSVLVSAVLIATCGSPTDAAGSPVNSGPSAAALEQAVSEAASISTADLGRVLEVGPASAKSLPLTALFFILSSSSPQERGEFGFDDSVDLRAFLRSFVRTPRNGRTKASVSAVNPKYIRRLVCVVNNGRGRGEIALGVEGVWHASFSFHCELLDNRWHVDEFDLPIRHVRLVLRSDGRWEVIAPRGAVHFAAKGAAGTSKMVESEAGRGNGDRDDSAAGKPGSGASPQQPDKTDEEDPGSRDLQKMPSPK